MDIQSFSTYYTIKMKGNLTKKQRLHTLERFFKRKLNEKVKFADAREAYIYITQLITARENEAEEILDEIYNLLEYSFSTQNPNYIYDMETELDFEKFERLMKDYINRDFSYGDFDYSLLETKIDTLLLVIEYEFEFSEYSIDEINGNRYRKWSGIINVTLDFKEKKFITSKSPNSKSHNNIRAYLHEVSGIKMNSFYVLRKKGFLNNRNDSEFSVTTLLIMNLIFETIPLKNYNIRLDSISFTNLNSKNIQHMKMRGTDLLRGKEVLQRVHSKDEVNNLKVTLEKVGKIAGNDHYLEVSFTIDMKGKMCFIFNNDIVINSKLRSICYWLQDSIIKLLSEESTIESGIQIIQTELPMPKSQSRVISDIFNDLSEVIKSEEDKVALERYFIEKFPTTFQVIKA